MSAMPVISGRECAKALQKAGYMFVRQNGSHIILRRLNPFSQLVVPDHKVIDRGTLRAIIRQAEMNVDEFVELL
jgi:predicted RNA binding protein YcfA (HicA-like mRNA interferase family)